MFEFTVYKGNSHLMFHQFYGALWFCTPNSYKNKTDCLKNLYALRKAHLENSLSDPVIPMSAPIRVCRGVPILGKFPPCFACYVEFTEFTDNLYTYRHDYALGASTLVLDQTKSPEDLLPGLYSASFKFIARREFWADKTFNNNSIYRRCDNVPVELILILNEFVGPLPESLKQEQASPKPFPTTFQGFVQDFRSTFNI